ncbi:MAG: CoA transferase, partial [Dehalococcoidia bacterium]
KRSIVVDLEQAEGPSLVRRLCAGADIFLTNLTASRQTRYCLTAADVHAEAPRVVHASLTAYGLDGPDSERSGFDNASFWAKSGIMGISGQPGSPPGLFPGGQGDHTAGLALFGAILAGLRARDTTGIGQTVDASLFAAGMWTIAADYSRTLITGQQPEIRHRSVPYNPLANTYLCSDGRWLILVMPQSDRFWPAFCRAVGQPEWEADTRFNSLAQRRENAGEVTSLIDAIFVTKTLDTWGPILDAAHLIWEPVATLPEVAASEQAAVAHRFVEIERESGVRFRTMDTPFRIRGAEVASRTPAPTLGGDTAAVLREAGLDTETVSDLASRGIFG